MAVPTASRSSATTTTATRTTPSSVPWQVEWKHPQWIPVQPDQHDQETDMPESQSHRAAHVSANESIATATTATHPAYKPLVTVGISSAQVALEECRSQAFWDPQWDQRLGLPGDSLSSSLQQQQQQQQQQHSFLLTLSLLAPSTTTAPLPSSTLSTATGMSTTRASSNVGATQVLLEFFYLQPSLQQQQQQQQPSQQQQQQLWLSQKLQWPESIQDSQDDDLEDHPNQHQDDESSLAESVSKWIMLQPWLRHSDRQKRRRQQRSRNTTSASVSTHRLVAATLCRTPVSESLQQAKQQEAKDMLDSMAFGLLTPMGGGSEPVTTPTGASKKDLGETSTSATVATSQAVNGNNTDDDNATTVTTSLSMACITTRGKLCIYSPWQLFPSHQRQKQQQQQQQQQQSMPNDDDIMAQWLLGANLFQQLQSAWLPLSQPQTTISPTLLQQQKEEEQRQMQQQQQQQQQHYEQAHQTARDDESTTNGHKQLQQRQQQLHQRHHPHPNHHLPNPLWNPWLDPNTLSLRTVANRPLSLHTTPTYLVLLGEGWRPDPSSLRGPSRKNSVAPSVDPITPTATSHTEGKVPSTPMSAAEIAVAASETQDSNDWWASEEPEVEKNDETIPEETEEAKAKDKEEDDWWTADQDATEEPPTTPSPKHMTDESKMEEDWWEADGLSPVKNEMEDIVETTRAANTKTESSPVKPIHQVPEVPVHFTPNGGFVTFFSMASWSETMTVFLDFIPRSVAPVKDWFGMELLIVLGDHQAVAIRLDVSSLPILLTDPNSNETHLDDLGEPSYLELSTNGGSSGALGDDIDVSKVITLKRFAVLPIQMPSDTSFEHSMTLDILPTMGSGMDMMVPRLLCAAGTSPPALLQCRSNHDRVTLWRPTFAGMTQGGSIVTNLDHCSFAEVPHFFDESKVDEEGNWKDSFWGYLGQGWSLLGTSSHVYFLCWEGATSQRHHSFVQLLENAPSNLLPPCHVTKVISSPYLSNALRSDQYSATLPFLSSDVVAEAMENISNEHPIQYSDRSNSMSGGFSDLPPSGAKSARLLRNLSSWTQLEDTESNRSILDRQMPTVSLKDAQGRQFVLSLRQVVVENGPTSPFSQVLGWLGQKRDYFTAASIALDLLHDPETLFHLWKNAEKIDEDDEQSKLVGLLDGISPLIPAGEDGSSKGDPKYSAAHWTQLADMTVACLIKGGPSMSKTLIKFLHTNQSYDAARASLMLVAAAVANVTPDSFKPLSSEPTLSQEQKLWPIVCLMEIGVARDYLPTTLDLLNVTIPDELRRRRRELDDSLPDLSLTQAIVGIIVGCHSSGAEELLKLEEKESDESYWDSLDDETRLSLTLTYVRSKFPLLFQAQVREWVRSHLHAAIQSVSGQGLSDEWLQNLTFACLCNAGCNLEDFVLEPTNVSNHSISSENSGIRNVMSEDRDHGLFLHRLEIVETRNALEPAPGSGGIDLDLLIPCLLMLRLRQTPWRMSGERYVSTQALLDAACHFAGRRGSEEPRFPLDGSRLMQQCALNGNVRAGANLIGGRKGLILSCCDILMLELQMSMAHAEALLLEDSLNLELLAEAVSSKFQPSRFELTDSHRQLLWLLDEHVLSMERYGDFQAFQSRRGPIDPLFCTQSIFRTWYSLTKGCLPAASKWMVSWLSGRLGMTDEESKEASHHRLACAALVRTLVWPSNVEAESDDSPLTPLGQLLEFEHPFLIKLARSACGLIEAIPEEVSEGLVGLSEVSELTSSSLATIRMSRTLGSG